jgi:hypothetical protein
LQELIYDVDITVLDDTYRAPIKNVTGHQLYNNRKFFFTVSHSELQLSSAINAALDIHLSRDATKVPYEVVDELVATSYENNDLSYAIYILAPNVTKNRFNYLYYTFSQNQPQG